MIWNWVLYRSEVSPNLALQNDLIGNNPLCVSNEQSSLVTAYLDWHASPMKTIRKEGSLAQEPLRSSVELD